MGVHMDYTSAHIIWDNDEMMHKVEASAHNFPLVEVIDLLRRTGRCYRCPAGGGEEEEEEGHWPAIGWTATSNRQNHWSIPLVGNI